MQDRDQKEPSQIRDQINRTIVVLDDDEAVVPVPDFHLSPARPRSRLAEHQAGSRGESDARMAASRGSVQVKLRGSCC